MTVASPNLDRTPAPRSIDSQEGTYVHLGDLMAIMTALADDQALNTSPLDPISVALRSTAVAFLDRYGQ